MEAIGYDAGSDLPIFTKAYTTAGTNAGGAGALSVPLEVSALIRYATTQRTSKNHPIYLFNYMRGVKINSGSNRELLDTTFKGRVSTYAAAWVTGFSDGTTIHHRAGPNGAVAQSQVVGTYVTHRDFPN